MSSKHRSQTPASRSRKNIKLRGSGDITTSRPASAKETKLRTIGAVPAGKAIGGALGSLYGDSGRTVGSTVGNLLHRGIKWLTGWGDYGLKSHNTMVNNRLRNSGLLDQNTKWTGILPDFAPDRPNGADGIDLIFNETGVDVVSTTAFGNTSYDVDMTNALLFPWGSGSVVMYEQYQILGMVFHFRSLVGSMGSSSSGTLGKVCLSSQYDFTDAPPSYMQQAEDSDYASAYAATESFVHIIECKPRDVVLPLKAVRPSAPPDADKTLHAHCRLNISTVGFATVGATVGTLYVSYKVRLLKPTLSKQLEVGAAHYRRQSTVTITHDGVGWAMWGQAGEVPIYKPIETGTLPVRTLSAGGANYLYLPRRGTYLIVLSYFSGPGADFYTGIDFAPGPGISLLALGYPHSGMFVSNFTVGVATAVAAHLMAMWDGTGDGAIRTYNMRSSVTQFTSALDLIVTHVGPYVTPPAMTQADLDARVTKLANAIVDAREGLAPSDTVVSYSAVATTTTDDGLTTMAYPWPATLPFPPEAGEVRSTVNRPDAVATTRQTSVSAPNGNRF